MLKFRASDNTLAASTYGRGVWSTTVCATASVTTQPPASTTVCVGNPVTFTISATGDAPLTYQWQVSTNGGTSWSNIGGATTNSYTFTTAAGDNGNKYRAYVIGSCSSSDTSSAATLTTTTVTLGGTVSPATINACAGNNSTTLTLSGNVGNIVRWEFSTDAVQHGIQ
ncbi:MAG: immunoglobulin domain-containing protein [Ferruginibacter sp.]